MVSLCVQLEKRSEGSGTRNFTLFGGVHYARLTSACANSWLMSAKSNSSSIRTESIISDWNYVLDCFALSLCMDTYRVDYKLSCLAIFWAIYTQGRQSKHEDPLRMVTPMHAFGTDQSCERYLMKQVAEKIVNACGGLPLSLKILSWTNACMGRGHYKFGKKTLDRLLTARHDGSPHEQIWETLKISFNELGDREKKNLIIDISCFSPTLVPPMGMVSTLQNRGRYVKLDSLRGLSQSCLSLCRPCGNFYQSS